MSLIPTVYRSTDPGAPVLSGTAGSFAALMDAVLVNGYGTGPDAKPGLGWVRAFSDGHKRAYQNSLADGGTGMFWRIDDSNAQYVLNSAFHSMSGIDTGVDEFGGGNNAWGKSITANTTARQWVAVGNSRSVYIFVQNGSTWSGSSYVGHLVGDYQPLNKSFEFNFCLHKSGEATMTGAADSALLRANIPAWPAMVVARGYSGAVVGVSVRAAPSLVQQMVAFGGSTGGAAYPYPSTSGLLASRVAWREGGVWVGFPPGLLVPEHQRPFAPFTEVAPNGVAGTWLVVQGGGDGSGSAATQGLLRLDAGWEY